MDENRMDYLKRLINEMPNNNYEKIDVNDDLIAESFFLIFEYLANKEFIFLERRPKYSFCRSDISGNLTIFGKSEENEGIREEIDKLRDLFYPIEVKYEINLYDQEYAGKMIKQKLEKQDLDNMEGGKLMEKAVKYLHNNKFNFLETPIKYGFSYLDIFIIGKINENDGIRKEIDELKELFYPITFEYEFNNSFEEYA